MVRAIAGVFALAGPVAVVVGVRGLLRGETGVRRLLTRRLLYLPPWFLAAGVVILAVALWLAWRKAGPLRRIWSSGTGPQRGACVAATVAAAGFLALSATGWTMLAVISWLIGMLAVVTLLAAGREERVDEGSPAS
jgi:hypothetical protein